MLLITKPTHFSHTFHRNADIIIRVTDYVEMTETVVEFVKNKDLLSSLSVEMKANMLNGHLLYGYLDANGIHTEVFDDEPHHTTVQGLNDVREFEELDEDDTTDDNQEPDVVVPQEGGAITKLRKFIRRVFS